MKGVFILNELDLDLETLIKKIHLELDGSINPKYIERTTFIKGVYDRRKRRERIRKAEYYDADSIPDYKLPDWYDK